MRWALQGEEPWEAPSEAVSTVWPCFMTWCDRGLWGGEEKSVRPWGLEELRTCSPACCPGVRAGDPAWQEVTFLSSAAAEGRMGSEESPALGSGRSPGGWAQPLGTLRRMQEGNRSHAPLWGGCSSWLGCSREGRPSKCSGGLSSVGFVIASQINLLGELKPGFVFLARKNSVYGKNS